MMKFIKQNKREFYIFLSILTAAFLIRIFFILKGSIPIFADEAIYIRWAQVMRAEPSLRFLPLSDGKQPLFMWMMIPLFKIITDPLIAGRLLSTLCGLGTLLGIAVLSFLIFTNKKLTLVSASIYAVSPFAVFFDSMALVDSMLSLWGVWTLVFTYLTVRYRRLDTAMLAGFTLGAALLTKSPAIYFAILLPLALILVDGKNLKDKIIGIFKTVPYYLPVYLIACAMYNILRLGPNFNMLTLRNQDYVYPLSHFFLNPLDPFLPYFDRVIQWLWLLGPGLFVIFIIISLIMLKKNYALNVIFIGLWGVIPIMISAEFAKVFTARYIFFSIPMLVILAASIFLHNEFKRFFNLLLVIFLLHAFVVDGLLIFAAEKAPLPKNERSGYLEEWTAGYGIKEAASYITRYHEANPDKKIVVGTEGYFGTLPDGLQIFMNKFPEVVVIGTGLDISELPISLAESKNSGNTTFLVINDSRLKVKPERIGLSLIASYPKAMRSPGTRKYNLLGPRESLELFEVVAVPK